LALTEYIGAFKDNIIHNDYALVISFQKISLLKSDKLLHKTAVT